MASILIPEGLQDLNDVLAPIDTGPSTETPAGNSVQRRIFIGPMPDSVIAQTVETQPKRAKLNVGSVFSLSETTARGGGGGGDQSEEVARVLKDNAFKFFLHHGGKADDWKEDDEQDLVDELVRRWKGSEWGQLWEHRQERTNETTAAAVSDRKWFGTSFEVGVLLGVDIIQSQQHLNSFSVPSPSERQDENLEFGNSNPVDEQLTSASALSGFPETIVPKITTDALNSMHSGEEDGVGGTPTSKTSLIASGQYLADYASNISSNILGPSTSSLGLDPNRHLSAMDKGKSKVHYLDNANSGLESTSAVPEVTLESTRADLNNDGAVLLIPDTVKSPAPSEFSWGDVVLRDRMLVRVNHAKSESLPQFDDSVNRSARDLEYENWGEFLVVWRRDGLEIYKDYATPFQEWATGHKHLEYVIPLKSSKTKLSLYSFVDLTFCITCAPTTRSLNDSGSRWVFTRSKEGTQIFVFKHRSRSRACDWYWQLWRHLGGRIPRSIDVYNPRLNTKVTIDIPDSSATRELYRTFRRENLIQLCLESLQNVPDYKFLIESSIEAGKSPQLAWRYQTNLDWIWLDNDIFGKPREWSVLCGLAFKQSTRPPTLEIRLGEHASNFVYLKNRKKIEEPASIEGYLDNIRSHKQKQPVYLASHSGYLFFLSPGRPFPPTPPGPTPPSLGKEYDAALKHTELRRGINQIVQATGMMDLRSIVAVRRAFQLLPSPKHDVKEPSQDDDRAWFEAWVEREEQSSEDNVDEGGEVALAQAYDSAQVKVRRSFELLLNTGHVMRFEAYSCRVAIEWIERLRALSLYWKRRHRTDAQQELELSQVQRPRLTPLTRVCHEEQEVASVNTGSYATADAFYHWCILEGCKPIVKAGRIYMRRGLRGQFKLVQLFLIAGHLISFRIDGQSSLYPPIKKKVNLVEAYVCSGYFAAQALPRGQYSPNAPPAPRRYGDGLETEDREEDMSFMIWYRSHPQMLHANQDPTTTYVDGKIRNLSHKFHVVHFKTRSCIERDAWCWAINSEIEKITRAQVKRETRLLEAGNIISLSQ